MHEPVLALKAQTSVERRHHSAGAARVMDIKTHRRAWLFGADDQRKNRINNIQRAKEARLMKRVLIAAHSGRRKCEWRNCAQSSIEERRRNMLTGGTSGLFLKDIGVNSIGGGKQAFEAGK